MHTCSECDTKLDFEEDELDEGDTVSCEECGAEYEVVGTDPLELARRDGDGYDDDEDDPDEDDEEEEEDED